MFGGGVEGFSLSTFSLNSSMVEAMKGLEKVHNSNRITPKDQISLFSVYGLPSQISGAK